MRTQFTTQVLKLQKELEFRNYSKQTIKNYCFSMLTFEQRMAKPLNELVIDDLKNYLHDRIIIEKVSTSFVNGCISAFKIYWEDVLRKEWEELKIKRPRVASKLPVVLSVEEIEKMISLTTNIKHKALITVMYSAGLRRAEVLNLKIGDIDSGRMMIRVNQGKGKKDRNTILSPKALDLLRKYYKRYKPKLHLFEATYSGKPTLCDRTVEAIVKQSATRAKISKHVSCHTLRHSFATHLLEKGTNIRVIQEFLGHSSIKTTSMYLHLTTHNVSSVISPLEQMNI